MALEFKIKKVDEIPKELTKLDKDMEGEKTKRRPIVIVDKKESSLGKKSGGKQIYENLLKIEEKGFLQVEVQNLGDSIDYIIPTMELDNIKYHLMQRKTVSELFKMDKMFADIREMHMVDNAEVYLLLEGNISSLQRWSKIRPASLIGAVDKVLRTEIYGGLNCKIIPSPNWYYTSLWLFRRAVKVGTPQKKKIDTVIRDTILASKLKPHQRALYFMKGIDGINDVLGRRLLQFYGTPWNAFSNLDNWVKDIQRMPKKAPDIVRAQLNARWVEEE